MAGKTQNYSLIKPADDDFYDIADFNNNAEIIDKELKKRQDAIEKLEGIKNVTLPAANWTGTEAPFVQTVTVEGITETDKPSQGIIYPENCTRDQQKAINKAAGYLYDLETGDGTITFRSTLKPTVDITLGLKGVN